MVSRLKDGWRQPALLEMWVQPDNREAIIWKTRRRGFKYELSFESVELWPVSIHDTPTHRGLHLEFPAPTVECRKRKELDAIAEHYRNMLTERGYSRVYSFNK